MNVGQGKMEKKKNDFIDIPLKQKLIQTINMSDQLQVSMCLFIYYLCPSNGLVFTVM